MTLKLIWIDSIENRFPEVAHIIYSIIIVPQHQQSKFWENKASIDIFIPGICYEPVHNWNETETQLSVEAQTIPVHYHYLQNVHRYFKIKVAPSCH